MYFLPVLFLWSFCLLRVAVSSEYKVVCFAFMTQACCSKLCWCLPRALGFPWRWIQHGFLASLLEGVCLQPQRLLGWWCTKILEALGRWCSRSHPPTRRQEVARTSVECSGIPGGMELPAQKGILLSYRSSPISPKGTTPCLDQLWQEFTLRCLDSILKSKDITLPTKVNLIKAMIFQ